MQHVAAPARIHTHTHARTHAHTLHRLIAVKGRRVGWLKYFEQRNVLRLLLKGGKRATFSCPPAGGLAPRPDAVSYTHLTLPTMAVV